MENARSRISAEMAAIDELPDRQVRLAGYTYNLDWMARMLASLGCRLQVRKPSELTEALRRHAAEIASWVDTPAG